ncbi:helix-turn-helix transcriptional regulator [Flavobacterium gyeonganense]|uniref:Helix-turn-helix transcriptional regulator n=1 Tax=Flavobacterium gyeonganense TaxID=1310418 RepID=A0ABV5HDW2_9FLAO|nr:helix-turn-helix transcriptional regulator [Flavobacterium gyeonganense]
MTAGIKENIKNIRELKNYTQEYMAERLNISQAAYSKIEKGKTEITLLKLQEIATVFEITIEDILQFKNDLSSTGKKTSECGIETRHCSNHFVEQLYKDKIMLLERLLEKTEWELKRYTANL